jgi:hypothetical protein
VVVRSDVCFTGARADEACGVLDERRASLVRCRDLDGLVGGVGAGGVPAQDAPHGVTVEAGFGAGFVRTGGPYSRFDSITFGGSAGAAWWVTPRTAIGLRGVLERYHVVSGDDQSEYRYWFVGPSVQHWLTPWAWVSGGIGYAQYQHAVDDSDDFHTFPGVGLDLRAGVSGALVDGSRHRFGAWLEVVPATYRHRTESLPPGPVDWDVYVSTTINVGYQLRYSEDHLRWSSLPPRSQGAPPLPTGRARGVPSPDPRKRVAR